MSCQSNKKRFLFFSFRGPHTPIPHFIAEVKSWGLYKVVYACEKCGERLGEENRNFDDLEHEGISPDLLSKTAYGHYIDKKELDKIKANKKKLEISELESELKTL